MGKSKAAMATRVKQPSSAAVLPKPQLVGERKATAEGPAADDAKQGPTPRHEPTLIGLPKHLPTALPPLKPRTSLTPPAPSKKAESSLVGLSRKLLSEARPPKTGTRLKAPSPPPTSAAATTNTVSLPANQRNSREPTDYDVDVIAAFPAPQPTPSRAPHAEQTDDSWQADVELIPERSKQGTLLAAGVIAVLCSLALAVCAYATSTPEAAQKPATAAPHAATPSAAPDLAASVPATPATPPTTTASAPSPALHEQLAPATTTEPNSDWLAPSSSRPRAQRALKAHRPHLVGRKLHRKVARKTAI